jgi:hypothetical protein
MIQLASFFYLDDCVFCYVRSLCLIETLSTAHALFAAHETLVKDIVKAPSPVHCKLSGYNRLIFKSLSHLLLSTFSMQIVSLCLFFGAFFNLQRITATSIKLCFQLNFLSSFAGAPLCWLYLFISLARI